MGISQTMNNIEEKPRLSGPYLDVIFECSGKQNEFLQNRSFYNVNEMVNIIFYVSIFIYILSDKSCKQQFE